jgi:hypothetical protein
MNIRIPISIEEDLRFCSEEFQQSYPKIGDKTLKWFKSLAVEERYSILSTENDEKLSKEGYNLGKLGEHYGTEASQIIIKFRINQVLESHIKNHIPLKLDEYTFETDEQQLLISISEDRLKEKVLKLIEKVDFTSTSDYIIEDKVNDLITKIKEV